MLLCRSSCVNFSYVPCAPQMTQLLRFKYDIHGDVLSCRFRNNQRIEERCLTSSNWSWSLIQSILTVKKTVAVLGEKGEGGRRIQNSDPPSRPLEISKLYTDKQRAPMKACFLLCCAKTKHAYSLRHLRNNHITLYFLSSSIKYIYFKSLWVNLGNIFYSIILCS